MTTAGPRLSDVVITSEMRAAAIHEVMMCLPELNPHDTHTFELDGPDACFLEDKVEYALPFGFLGRWVGGKYVRNKLAKLFEYRHEVTVRELAAGRGAQ